MKIGIVSDIHGNTGALLRAFELMGDADEFFCLGDCINQYRFSNPVVELLKERNVHTIWGNHEEVFYGPLGTRARGARWIDPGLLEWLARRPPRIEVTMAGRRLLLVHSTPSAPYGGYITANHASFAKFGETAADIVLYGHTHEPVATRVGRTLVVNPGSVGEGRPVDDGYLQSCALLDLATEAVDIREFRV